MPQPSFQEEDIFSKLLTIDEENKAKKSAKKKKEDKPSKTKEPEGISDPNYVYNYDQPGSPATTKSPEAFNAPSGSTTSGSVVEGVGDGKRTAAATVKSPFGRNTTLSLDAVAPSELTDAGGYKSNTDDRYSWKSKAGGSLKTDTGMTRKLPLDLEVLKQLPGLLATYKTPTMKAREEQANETAAALKALLANYKPTQNTFDISKVLYPAGALLDVWAGRGKMADIFAYPGQEKKDKEFERIAEVSKQLAAQRQAIADDERQFLQLLIGNKQTEGMNTTLDAFRQAMYGSPLTQNSLAAALAKDRFEEAKTKTIEEGVADYEKAVNESALNDLMYDLGTASEVLKNYNRKDAPGYYYNPLTGKKWRPADWINNMNPLLSDEERSQSIELANAVKNIRSAIVKRYSGSAFTAGEVRDTEQRLGTALTQGPEDLRRQLDIVRKKILKWEEIKRRKYRPEVKQEIEKRGIGENVKGLESLEFDSGGNKKGTEKIETPESSEKNTGSPSPDKMKQMREGLKDIWKTK